MMMERGKLSKSLTPTPRNNPFRVCPLRGLYMLSRVKQMVQKRKILTRKIFFWMLLHEAAASGRSVGALVQVFDFFLQENH